MIRHRATDLCCCLRFSSSYLFSRLKCGNCSLLFIQNAYECQCCMEIEEFAHSLNHEDVINETGQLPNCITAHPGFRPVCLGRWSLCLAADKYCTKIRRKSRQTESEER